MSTAEHPKITTILGRTNAALEREPFSPAVAAQINAEIRETVNSIDAKRLQRDQRYAIAVNAVTQARKHSGRDVEVASPEDANITNMIFSLLQKVADAEVPGPDKLFSNIPKMTSDAFLELMVATCTRPQNEKREQENFHSTDNSEEQ